MKKKVLITNAVPVNNGDAALVFSLVDKLKSLDYEVTIATNYFSFVRSKYPEYSFIRELGDYFLLKKLPFLKPLFMRLNFRFNHVVLLRSITKNLKCLAQFPIILSNKTMKI